MKKLTIYLTINHFFLNLLKQFSFFDQIISSELIEILKIDMEKGYKIILVKLTLKSGCNLNNLKLPGNSKIISVLQEDGNNYVCLLKGEVPNRLFNVFKKISSKFNLDLIWTTPTKVNGKNILISAIGDENNLQKLLKNCKLIGDIKKISFSKPFADGYDILSCLTDKQKEVIFAAKNNGYYEYPRKISADKLSKQIGISKATTVEHLRKAEKRIMAQIIVDI
jgi:hypothetical protein